MTDIETAVTYRNELFELSRGAGANRSILAVQAIEQEGRVGFQPRKLGPCLGFELRQECIDAVAAVDRPAAPIGAHQHQRRGLAELLERLGGALADLKILGVEFRERGVDLFGQLRIGLELSGEDRAWVAAGETKT